MACLFFEDFFVSFLFSDLKMVVKTLAFTLLLCSCAAHFPPRRTFLTPGYRSFTPFSGSLASFARPRFAFFSPASRSQVFARVPPLSFGFRSGFRSRLFGFRSRSPISFRRRRRFGEFGGFDQDFDFRFRSPDFDYREFPDVDGFGRFSRGGFGRGFDGGLAGGFGGRSGRGDGVGIGGGLGRLPSFSRGRFGEGRGYFGRDMYMAGPYSGRSMYGRFYDDDFGGGRRFFRRRGSYGYDDGDD